MAITETASAILAEHSLTGRLVHMYADRWQYRASRGADGVAVEIQSEVEPGEATLREAAGMMAEALAA